MHNLHGLWKANCWLHAFRVTDNSQQPNNHWVSKSYRTTMIWTPICVWYVVRCGSKNGHQKDMCSKVIGLHVSNMLIIQVSTINMIGETYMFISWTQISSFWWCVRLWYELQNFMKANGYRCDLDVLSVLY